MGTASQALSVVFRVGELICAAIVAGILGRYLDIIDQANVGANGRIVYTVVIAGISIFFSLVLLPPLKYSFWACPFDFAMFVCWMVAFGLLINLTVGHGCNSYWYWHSWGYYWGGWWHTVPINTATQSLIGTAHCSTWRTSQAFSFIGGWAWLANALIGAYVCVRDYDRTKESKVTPIAGDSPVETSQVSAA